MARILIVEDSPDNMKLFRAVLEFRGHEVTGLSDGHGLVDAIAGARPDLVLMDIQLPDCDGYALLEQIRLSPYHTVPVVALTAHAMVGDEERAREAGFLGYITKPIDVTAFPAQVEAILRGQAGTDFASPGSAR